ncbi:olfactory receptor 6C74-like [Bombina bombina]|uniref:olfactory receptor 6C74-like n=1 Tax=Bombina bombina TaxID=8345 RepID=UPI00235A954F|nr:olfactory receptor 6C74-like [Bombina bombina]
MSNQTMYFIIKGISSNPALQAPIFCLVLCIYIITVSGNMSILTLACLDKQLHNPMYFFLGNLSLLDISSITVTLHKILSTFISGNKLLPWHECIAQLYFFMALQCTELLILAVMSYDRYVAICYPLHYTMIMNFRVCAMLAVFCWVLGFIEVSPHTNILAKFSCYTSNEVNHFFCDVLPIMKLTCNDTSLLKLWIFTEGVFFSGLLPFSLTVFPYILILRTVLKMRSKTGKRKAFYTCSSHLTVVILLYLTLYCLYLAPTSDDVLESRKLFSLFNTAAVPLLNPIIYSLKNKDVKSAMRHQWTSFYSMISPYLSFVLQKKSKY